MSNIDAEVEFKSPVSWPPFPIFKWLFPECLHVLGLHVLHPCCEWLIYISCREVFLRGLFPARNLRFRDTCNMPKTPEMILRKGWIPIYHAASPEEHATRWLLFEGHFPSMTATGHVWLFQVKWPKMNKIEKCSPSLLEAAFQVLRSYTWQVATKWHSRERSHFILVESSIINK